MILVAPNELTLISTNVIETALDGIYNNTTDYIVDATVTHAKGVWKVLAANGPASTVITPGSDALAWEYVCPAPYDAALDYAIQERVTFDHKVYTSYTVNGPASTVITPGTDALVWHDDGATNAYKFLDEYITTQTLNSDLIEVKLNTARFDLITLFGFVALTITIEIRDQIDDTLLKTIEVPYTDIITPSTSWSDYFFSDAVAKQIITVDTGEYYGAHVVIKLNSPGGVARLGHVIIGKQKLLGKTLYPASMGVIDFSKTQRSTEGNLYLKVGNYARRNSYPILIENTQLDIVDKMLISRLGKLSLFLGNKSYESFTVYGIVKSSGITVPGVQYSEINLEIEGIAQ